MPLPTAPRPASSMDVMRPPTADRRGFLKAGAAGLAAPALAGDALAASRRSAPDHSGILIFNLGGPGQLDTFDPKPEAPAEIRGPFGAVRTAVPGVMLSELLPRHAALADRFALVRTVHHDLAAVHDTGRLLMQTGWPQTAADRAAAAPHVGCVAECLLGARPGVPGHVLLPAPASATGGGLHHGQDAGWLGQDWDPLALGVDPAGPLPLQDALEARLRSLEADPRTAADPVARRTVEQLSSPRFRAACALDREAPAVRDRYGRNRLGQSLLLARRLVEAGVRFVTVNAFQTIFGEPSWDTHGDAPFTSPLALRNTVAPHYDQAYAALVTDLAERGLLATTMVAALAEFGRTPRLNAAGGRDHWPHCWSVALAGAGLRGGAVVGRSDRWGAFPVDRPVAPAELVATMHRALGVPATAVLPMAAGGTRPLLPAGARALDELF